MKKFLVFLIATAGYSCIANEYASAVYEKIEDICHPTINDYLKIQEYLSHGHIPLFDLLDPWQYQNKLREFRFVGSNQEDIIERGVIPVNCGVGDKEDCILLFASFNYEYPKAVRRLIEILKKSDFKGHILYRIGGWPNLEEGGLLLSHIPFAFKICFFREAQRLGYRNALWLDSSIIPIKGVDRIFSKINEKGIFTYTCKYNLQELSNPTACAAMGISFEEARDIPGCLAGIVGFNFENNLARKALDTWYDYTKNREEASFSPRQEFCVMSAVMYQLGISKTLERLDGKVTWEKNEINQEGMEFFVDKYFVQPNWPN